MEAREQFGLERLSGNSLLVTNDESQNSVSSIARMPSKPKSISVTDHPSQVASSETICINHDEQEENNLSGSDDDRWSFKSESTVAGQRKTVGGLSTLPSQQMVVPVHSSSNPESSKQSVSESSIRHDGVEHTSTTSTSTSAHEVKLPSAHLPDSATAATTSGHLGDMAVAKLPSPSSDWLCHAASINLSGSPPGPDAVVDPLDSSSSELIEVVCATVNSKWPILARYFSLPEECVADIKEQDAGAEGKCRAVLTHLSKKGLTWKALYDVLLKKLRLNILACKLARVIGLPTPDGEVAQFHQIKFDIHCSTHKVVLLQLSQATSENWVKLSKLLNFSQIANEDIAHISNTLVDADECCCEMLLQWITWRQAQVKSASPGAHPVTFGELFSYTEAAISGTEMEKVVQAAKCVL